MEWEFLREMMTALKLPISFINWIMTCVTTSMFTIMVNGSMNGFFESKRGLIQGDLISPLLFVIYMKYLSCLMRKVMNSHYFDFHLRCKKPKLNHKAFADDVILYCKGNY